MKIYTTFIFVVASLGLHTLLYLLLSQLSKNTAEDDTKYWTFTTVQNQNPVHYEIFYAIFSAPSDIEQRNTWRTEGLWSNRCLEHFNMNNVSLVYRFVVGHDATYDLEVLSEQKRDSDVIVLDMHDGYHNLTRKLGKLMEWSTFNCPFTFDTMLRMDMDVFPNPFRVQEYAKTLPSMTLSGFVWKGSSVIQD